MFRFLQGLPRALRSTIQAGYNTHHRSPAATHPSNHPDDSDKQTAVSTLLPIVFSNHSISRLHTKAGGYNEHDGQNDWRSFNKHHHWQSFNGHNNFEAVGWGTAIIISLQLCRGLSIFTHPDSDKNENNGPKHMLTSIAYAMPMLDKTTINGVQMKVLDEEKCRDAKPKCTARQYDAAQNLETSAELEEAFQKLQSVSDESVGMVHNTLGLEEARKGNRNTAAEHFLKGSAMGYCKAKFNMAVCYEQGRGVDQDLNKAIKLYDQAATQGHAMAQYNLGVLHLQGRGNAQFDTNKAMELITAAANQGLTQAQSYLGAYYLKTQDASKAVELLKEAANKQDKEALYHLGVCYQYGLGIECNTAKAASYYHKSANKGYMPAVYCLGTFYEQGLGGLPENLQHAKELYEYASQGGNQEAQIRLKQLHEAETQRQLQKAQKQSKSRLTLKRNQSQTKISKPIHASASEPSLSTTATKTVAEESQQMAAIVKHLSYLALFMPYYNIGYSKADGSGGESDNIPVRFQVGGGPVESEIAGLGQVSEPLNSGLSVLSVS